MVQVAPTILRIYMTSFKKLILSTRDSYLIIPVIPHTTPLDTTTVSPINKVIEETNTSVEETINRYVCHFLESAIVSGILLSNEGNVCEGAGEHNVNFIKHSKIEYHVPFSMLPGCWGLIYLRELN